MPKKNTGYKLLQNVNNNVRYYGQEKTLKGGDISAMFICPKCDELWRARINNVVRGSTKSCGCKKD